MQKNNGSQLPTKNDTSNTFMGKEFGETCATFSLQEFWLKYKISILRLIWLILLVIISLQVYSWVNKYRIQKMQEEYAHAKGTDALLAFAQNNKSFELAGITFLQLADQKYSEGNYAEAASLYAQAQKSLKKSELSGRAKLGEAMALTQNNEIAKGHSLLEALSQNGDINPAIRAQAFYHLVILAISQGDYAAAKSLTAQLKNASPHSPWAQKVVQIEGSIPELSAN